MKSHCINFRHEQAPHFSLPRKLLFETPFATLCRKWFEGKKLIATNKFSSNNTVGPNPEKGLNMKMQWVTFPFLFHKKVLHKRAQFHFIKNTIAPLIYLSYFRLINWQASPSIIVTCNFSYSNRLLQRTCIGYTSIGIFGAERRINGFFFFLINDKST